LSALLAFQNSVRDDNVGVKFNFKRISLCWLLWLLKVLTQPTLDAIPSTVHLY